MVCVRGVERAAPDFVGDCSNSDGEFSHLFIDHFFLKDKDTVFFGEGGGCLVSMLAHKLIKNELEY